MGKTALALHLAHGLAAEGYFPDAQLYIDLKGSSAVSLSPAAALEVLLTTLLGPDPQRPHDEDTLAHLWRAALQDRQVLLVLDDAAGSAQVRPLLPGSPTCAVLITSQQRFALPGAGRLDLESLELEDARGFLQSLVPRLEDAEAYQIARQCGGLPLALRIAGNYLALNDDLSPVVYAAHLASEDARLDLLRDPGEPDLDVGATLASSIDRLSESMRRSLTVLAYLPAPFDVSTAAAVWGEGSTESTWQRLDVGETLDRLRILRNSSLLTFSPQTGRYGQHMLLRLAAGRELARLNDIVPSSVQQIHGSAVGAWQEYTEGARRRAAYHFLEMARSADEDRRYGELDPDWPHLRAALEYTSQLDADLFSELVQALNNYWSARGMAREQVVWNDLAARGFSSAGRQDAEGPHLGALGAAYDELGEPQQAIDAYGRAIRASRASGDQDGEASHLRGVGWAYQELGDTERAMLYYQQSLDLHREMGNVQGEVAALGCLGRACAQLDDHRQAIGYLQQAVALAQESGDRLAEGAWLGALAVSYAELGDAHQAVDTTERALSIVRASGNRREEAALLVGLGHAYTLLDQGTEARQDVDGQEGAWDGVGVDGPWAEGRAWGEEVELTPIRQITVPRPRGVEVWIDSPFPPDLDLADVVDQRPVTEGQGDLTTQGNGEGDVDLLVQDIWATTTPLTPGNWETLAFRIKNQGTASTCERFYLRMWFDNTLIRTWYVDGLGAGRTAVGWVQVKVAEAGSHQIRAHVDCSNCTGDSNPDNTVRTETWVWGEASGEADPSGHPGEPAVDGIEAQLAGPEPLLTEWGEESELAGIRQIMLPSLYGVDVRTSQDPQAQPLGWDPDLRAAAGQADLVVQDIWSTTTPLTPGDWTTIAFRVWNQGALSISARFYVRMWLDDTVAGTWYLDGLEAGRTAIGWVQAQVAEAGSYTIRVCADYGDAVPEASEDNNERIESWSWGEEAVESPLSGSGPEQEAARLAGPEPVHYDWGTERELTRVRQTVIPPLHEDDQPSAGDGQSYDEGPSVSRIGVDLAVLDIWSPTRPLEVGEWETIAFRITNQGTDAANPRFYTRMWFDRTLLRTWYADGLQSGVTGIGWVQLRVADPGSHQIRIQVDVTSAVAEADEENNVRSETWVWDEPQPAQIFTPPVAAPPVAAPPVTEPPVAEPPVAEPLVEGEVGTVITGQLPASTPIAIGSPFVGNGQAQARELWTEALEIYGEIGDPRSEEEVRARLDALDD